MASFSQDIIRSARVSEAEIGRLLDKLDAADAENPARNRRGAARVPWRKNNVACRIYHPGGSMTTTVIATRNISAGGVSFLYPGFLHKNTKVELILVRRLGGEDLVAGHVTHCQLLKGSLHQIGVRFASKVFPKLYLDPGEWSDFSDGGTVDAAKLAGRVLHLDGQEMDRLLLRHSLSETKVELVSVATVDEATAAIAAAAAAGGFDVVLGDLVVGDAPPDKWVAALRAAGHTGPVGVLTAETTPSRLKSAADAGVAAVLGKPYDTQKLLSLLGTWLSGDAGQGEALYSTLADSTTTRPLVEQYVQRARSLARDLRRHIEAEDLASVRTVCQTLRGTGAGFGFAVVSQIAKEPVVTLDETASVREAAAHTQRLEQACRRMSVRAAA